MPQSELNIVIFPIVPTLGSRTQHAHVLQQLPRAGSMALGLNGNEDQHSAFPLFNRANAWRTRLGPELQPPADRIDSQHEWLIPGRRFHFKQLPQLDMLAAQNTFF